MVESWPEWWAWELELSSHVEKRMEDRDFTEVELRDMLGQATGYHEDILDGRWVIETRHRRRPWGVIVEPDRREHLLVVITAYEVDR
jgi:hypothetical protein